MFWIIDDIIIALWCCETAGKFNNNFPLVSSGIERRGEKWNKENFRVVERGGKVDFMAVWAINYWIDSFCFFFVNAFEENLIVSMVGVMRGRLWGIYALAESSGKIVENRE